MNKVNLSLVALLWTDRQRQPTFINRAPDPDGGSANRNVRVGVNSPTLDRKSKSSSPAKQILMEKRISALPLAN
jgi:hypothetical protein